VRHDAFLRYNSFTILLVAALGAPVTNDASEGGIAAEPPVGAAIERALEAPTSARSRGDVERFCAGHDENAVFIPPSGLTRGRGRTSMNSAFPGGVDHRPRPLHVIMGRTGRRR
jgi:hypothetical protein